MQCSLGIVRCIGPSWNTDVESTGREIKREGLGEAVDGIDVWVVVGERLDDSYGGHGNLLWFHLEG